MNMNELMNGIDLERIKTDKYYLMYGKDTYSGQEIRIVLKEFASIVGANSFFICSVASNSYIFFA